MPGSVSDSYDPEWGTGERAAQIGAALRSIYDLVTCALVESVDGGTPMYILDLVDADLPIPIELRFTEKQWRLIRFALERAGESI